MKYLSLALIVFCLGFSWHLAHIDDTVSVRTHHHLQMAVSQVIQSAIEKQIPNATGFHVSKLYTETISDDSVKTFFGYSFQEAGEDQTERTIEGTAILNRDPNNKTNWSLSEIKVDQAAIEFEQGLTVKAGEDPAP